MCLPSLSSLRLSSNGSDREDSLGRGPHYQRLGMSVSLPSGKPVRGLEQPELARGLERGLADYEVLISAIRPANLSRTRLQSSLGRRNAHLSVLIVRACS